MTPNTTNVEWVIQHKQWTLFGFLNCLIGLIVVLKQNRSEMFLQNPLPTKLSRDESHRDITQLIVIQYAYFSIKNELKMICDRPSGILCSDQVPHKIIVQPTVPAVFEDM